MAAGKGLRPGTVGLTGSVVIAVSSVAPAYSLAAVLGGMVAVVGAQTPALFVIGFLPMMFTAFAFRELASETPDCGSAFTWATRAFGPWVGWLVGWASVIAATVAVGNGAQIAAIYLLKALHLNSLANSMAAQVAVGGLAVVGLLLLCLRGIDVTERTQAVLVAVQFAVLALVSVVALVKVSAITRVRSRLVALGPGLQTIADPLRRVHTPIVTAASVRARVTGIENGERMSVLQVARQHEMLLRFSPPATTTSSLDPRAGRDFSPRELTFTR